MAAGNTIVASQSVNPAPSVQTAATVLSANANRAGFLIQNQGTNPLLVLLGASASATSFHVSLKGGTALSDGNGGTFSMLSGTVYQGIVTSAGTAPAYTVLEI